MKIFRCQSCDQIVFFENTQCVNCGATLGFLPDSFLMSALEPARDDAWRPLALRSQPHLYRMCRNYSGEQVCNWMVPEHRQSVFCGACRFNQTIPDLTVPGNKALWQRLERAKHRLIYSLLRLGLPLIDKQDDPETGLAFAFLADQDPLFAESARAMTGHQHGLITINIAEAANAGALALYRKADYAAAGIDDGADDSDHQMQVFFGAHACDVHALKILDLLSLSEQQLLAFARVLIAAPSFAFLDQPSRALSDAQVHALLRRLRDRGITYLTLGDDDDITYYDQLLEIAEVVAFCHW